MLLSLLEKVFVKNREHPDDRQTRWQYALLSSCLGIFCNFLLFLGKGFSGYITGSVSIVADAFNNLSDAGSSVVTLAGFYAASRPADQEHPFGHGRMEYFSGLVTAVLILIVGIELGKNAILRIIHPQNITYSWTALALLGASVLVKLFMYRYNLVWGRKVESVAMTATAADSLSDAVATAAVLAGALLSMFTNWQLDGFIGLGVAAFIVYHGIQTVKESSSLLLGKAPSPELVQRITTLVTEHPQVLGLHDLIIHDYGPGRRIISLHMEMSSEMPLMEMHDLTDQMENQLRQTFACDVTIHMDPVTVNDERANALQQNVRSLLQEIHPEISLHDFRVVYGNTHTNLIFDVAVPHRFHLQDDVLAEQIRKAVRQRHPSCYAVLRLERSLV